MDLQAIYLFLQYGLIAVFVLGFAVFFGVSVVARDVEILKKKPFIFAIELLLVSLLPALPILFFVVSRGLDIATAITWMYGLSIKFALFHLVFQLSGFYTYLFT
jgi:hypothetical protein